MVDNDEFSAIYRQYYVLVRDRAAFLLRGDKALAEDVAHETFIHFIEYRAKNELRASPAALLYCIVNRVAIDKLRRHYRHTAAIEKIASRSADKPEFDDKIDLSRALEDVREEESRVGTDFYLLELDTLEIAETLQMSERTVKRRLRRFRQRLKTLLTVRLPKRMEP